MRLKFKVLCVDDHPDGVESSLETLERLLSEIGFELETTFVRNINELKEALGNSYFEDNVDLILVDYKLDDESGNGEVAMVEIRKRIRFVDILFYSSTEEEELRKIAYENRIDGVFFARRPTLPRDTYNLIRIIVKKILDIDHMRGIVMAATSDIDNSVKNILIELYARKNHVQKEEFTKKILKRIGEKVTERGEEYNRIKESFSIEEVLSKNDLCTSNMRTIIIKEELKEIKYDTQIVNKINRYIQEVIPKRNSFAHVEAIEEDGKIKLIFRGEEYTEDKLTELRIDLLDMQKTLAIIKREFSMQRDN